MAMFPNGRNGKPAVPPVVVLVGIIALVTVATMAILGVTVFGAENSTPVITAVLGFVAPTVASLFTLLRVETTRTEVSEVKGLVDTQKADAAAAVATAEHVAAQAVTTAEHVGQQVVDQAAAMLDHAKELTSPEVARQLVKEAATAAVREAIKMPPTHGEPIINKPPMRGAAPAAKAAPKKAAAKKAAPKKAAAKKGTRRR